MKNNVIAELPDTKRHLLEAGIALMRRKGYAATSVDEICLTAEVTKGAFFHYFKSKEDLAKAAIQWFQENRTKDFAQAPFRKLTDPLARVFGRLDYVQGVYTEDNRVVKGCLFGMFAQEMAANNPSLRGLCREIFEFIADDVEQDVAAAKARYAPTASFDPKKVAKLYVSIIQGSLMMDKTIETHEITLDNIEQFRAYIHCLFQTGKSSHSTEAPIHSQN